MRLQDCQIVYICPDHNDKYRARKNHIDSLLTRIGCKNFKHFKSSDANYPDCLGQANIDILTEYMDSPVLILEDDIEYTGISEIDMVPGADAIYLGLSICGGHPTLNKDEGPSQYTEFSKSQVRIQNMLATHAILYISPEYKKAVIDTIKKNMGKKYHTDVLMSRLHPKYFILANRQPSFYQAAAFNNCDHVEKCTKINFMNKHTDTTVVTAFYPMKSKYTVEKYMEWIELFCKIPCFLIIFTDKDTEEVLQKIRNGLPTTIIVRDFDTYEMTSPDMMKMWNKQHNLDPEKSSHNPLLYAIWALKQEFVENAIRLNPYETDWFVWCDIGIHRKAHEENYYRDFPGRVPSLCKPGHIGLLEVERIPDSYVTNPFQPYPFAQLGGGCITGDRNAWKLFSECYKKMLNTMESRNEFVGKDQNVFFRMVVERVMPFQLFNAIYRHNMCSWMQFPCILAGTAPVSVDDRFNIKNA